LRLRLLSHDNTSDDEVLSSHHHDNNGYHYSGFRMESSALRAMAMLKHFQGGRMTKVLGMSLKRHDEGTAMMTTMLLLGIQQQQEHRNDVVQPAAAAAAVLVKSDNEYDDNNNNVQPPPAVVVKPDNECDDNDNDDKEKTISTQEPPIRRGAEEDDDEEKEKATNTTTTLQLQPERLEENSSEGDQYSESTFEIRNDKGGGKRIRTTLPTTATSTRSSSFMKERQRRRQEQHEEETLAFPSGYQRLLSDATVRGRGDEQHHHDNLSLFLPPNNNITRQPPVDENGRTIRYRGFVFVLHETYGMMLLRCKTKKNALAVGRRGGKSSKKMSKSGGHHHRTPGGKIEDTDFHGEHKDLSFMAQWYFAARTACARNLEEKTGLSVPAERLRPVVLYANRAATAAAVNNDNNNDHGEEKKEQEGKEEELFAPSPLLVNEYKKRLFFVLKLTDDEYNEVRVYIVTLLRLF
jgi:hypothetical protein